MERDFMGISSKDSGGSPSDQDGGGRQDSGFVGGSAVQWPFSNKISALQHLMSLKTVPEEKPKRAAFGHLSSSGFQPTAAKSVFESVYRPSSLKEAPQRCFSLDSQSAHQFSMYAYQPQTTDTFGASNHSMVSSQSVPISMSSPFFKVHGSSNVPNLPLTNLKQQPFGGFTVNNPTLVGSISGAVVPRNMSKPTTSSQLTIFYAGSVNVYDDVPLDKAQAIMLMASKACGTTSSAPNQGPETPISSPLSKVVAVTGLNANHSVAQAQLQIKNPTISITSHIGTQSRSSSSTADDGGGKNAGVLPPPLNKSEPYKTANTSAPILTRAVPQARKASLARFLEKRKERVTNVLPYSCAKKSSENSTGVEDANFSSKCSSADLSLSSTREDSWCSVPLKNNPESPSTKLAM